MTRDREDAMTMFTTIADVCAFARTRGACRDALGWLRTHDDPRAAWEACERPDWMLWIAVRRGHVEPTAIEGAVRAQARTTREAIEAARARGDEAAYAAADAYAAAAADAAAYAYAAAAYAYVTAYAAADAAADADADAAWRESARHMCRIIREYIPYERIAA